MTRIYVASLSDYNAGRLLGAWIDLADCSFDSDAVDEKIQEMLKTSKEDVAEEWAIHDHEGFGGIKIGEYEDLADICTLAQAIEEHGSDKVSHAYDATNDADTVAEYIADNYQGHYKSKADFAYELADDMGDLRNVPDFIASHIDWDGVARDLFMGDYDSCDADDGGIHIFRVS